MVDAVQTTVETVKAITNAPCSNFEDLIKKLIADEFTQVFPVIISTTIKEISKSKLIDITINTSNSTTKSTVTGDTNDKEAHTDDNKNKNTTKNTQPERERERGDKLEQAVQSKKKTGTLTKAALLQNCESI
eukprot:5572911-Ditylum_brightwellii.AAC.1